MQLQKYQYHVSDMSSSFGSFHKISCPDFYSGHRSSSVCSGGRFFLHFTCLMDDAFMLFDHCFPDDAWAVLLLCLCKACCYGYAILVEGAGSLTH